MKLFIAIACLSFVANTLHSLQAQDVPPSLVGNLWRFKGHFANNIGDVSDRLVNRVKQLSPLRLLNLNLSAATSNSGSASPSLSAAPAKPIPRPINIAHLPIPAPAKPASAPAQLTSSVTTKPTPTSPTKAPVDCTKKKAIELDLDYVYEQQTNSLKKYGEDFDKIIDELEDMAIQINATNPRNVTLVDDYNNLQKEYENEKLKRKAANLLVENLIGKLAAYKSCP